MSPLQVTVLGALAGLTIFLGLPFGRMRRATPRLKAGLNAVAIGVLLFLEWDILTHGWAPVDTALSSGRVGGAALDGLVLFAGIAVGCAGLVFYDQRVTGRRTRAASDRGRRASAPALVGATSPQHVSTDQPAATSGTSAVNGAELAMLIAVGIGLHNFAEGLAIGNSAAAGELSLALLLVVGFGLHNATEGFGIVAPLAAESERPSWGRLLGLGLIGGGPTFVGTLVGQAFTSDLVSITFLGLAAGSVLYVIIELLAVARRAGPELKLLTTWCLLGGLGLGFVTDAVLVVAGV